MSVSQYVDIGQYLRDSRESLRIPLEQAARSLHIRPKYLRALESGKLDDMPGKAYIRGYIKNYADYLGLNAEETVTAYESLLAGGGRDFFIPEPNLKENLPSRSVIWGALLGIAILYFCWYFMAHDRSPAQVITADIPEEFMQMLDKTPRSAMDSSWKMCLSQDNSLCFMTLRAQNLTGYTTALYDLFTPANTPQKP